MSSDRYLKAILTIIALELFWIGVRDTATVVSAQPTPTPVIIRGVQIADNESRGALPVNILGATRALRIEAERPLRIEALRPLKIEADVPIRVETDRPLLVESVQYAPGARRPGE